MARSDYRGCDVCDGKAFYDANLNYEDADNEWAKTRGATPYLVAGDLQYPGSPEFHQKYGMSLDYVGDWAVVCTDCSPRFRTLIEPIPTNGEPEYLSWFRTPDSGEVGNGPPQGSGKE